MQVLLRSTGPLGFARGRLAGVPVPTQAFSNTCLFLLQSLLREFQGYEFCWLGAGVGYGVGVVAGEPFGFAGFEVAGHRAWAVPSDVAAKVEIGDGYQQVRAGVVVLGNYSAGLEFEFGDADAVFDEEDLFGAALEDVEGAVFVLGSHFAVELRRVSSSRISMVTLRKGRSELVARSGRRWRRRSGYRRR